MTRNAIRAAWTITAFAALGLLAVTVFLGMRARSLPESLAAAPSAAVTDSAGQESSEETSATDAAPTRVATLGVPADNGLIAFSSDRDGNAEIYTMRPDGSEPQRITDHPAEDRSPSWTLDGSRLVWLRIEQGLDAAPSWSAMSAASDGADQRSIIAGDGWPIAGAENPVADQAALYVVEDGNDDGEPNLEDQHRLLLIDLANPDAEPLDLLAGLEGVAPSPRFGNGVLQWSADGATLYLLLDVNGEDGLYALPVAGGPPELVSAGQVELAALSPDGTQMAIWREFEDTGRRRRRLFLHDLESGQESAFQMGGLGFQAISGLSWSRDGSRLVFSGFTGGSAPNIVILDVALDALDAVSQRVADPAFTPPCRPTGRKWSSLPSHTAP
ncbi:MAG: PD40 domain-containing protein [Caldilineae bacterium]|nr:PD40 domain-containing protein [Caldilineae bacterium]